MRPLHHVPRATRYWLLTLYLLVLFWATLAPLPAEAGDLPGWFDKAAHWGLFAGFAALLYWARDAGRRTQWMSVLGWSVAVDALIEIVQSPLPFRSGDPWDFAWGVGGALVGYAVAHAVLHPSAPR